MILRLPAARLFPLVSAALVAASTVAACGDDTSTPTTDVADTTPTHDTTDDDTAAPDVADDTATDDIATTDVSDDTIAACEHPCLNDQGRNDRRLCPQPITDWQCVDGCCEAVFKCQDDNDCRTEGYALGQCKDDRYDCRCDVPTGACSAWYCKVDGDCDEGSFCIGGACLVDPDGPLSLRLLGPDRIVLMTGFTHAMRVDAYREVENVVYARAVTPTFTTTNDAVATVAADGTITAAGAGTATIRASIDGSEPVELAVTVLSVDPTDTLTIGALSERTFAPVAGVYLINTPDGLNLEADEIPADGVIRWNANGVDTERFDVHILSEDHDWVTWHDVPAGTVRLTTLAPSFYGRVQLDAEKNILADATTLDQVGLVRGTPDVERFAEVSGLDLAGNIELVLTSTGLSSALFDFSLPALLGADVKRFFDPRNTIPRVDTAEAIDIPGGIVFNIANPAIPEFNLTAPRGTLKLWSLGGRLDINDLAEYSAGIFAAFGGGALDFTQIVGAVFPLFRNFWSGYTEDVTVETVGDPNTIVNYDPVLTTPMTMATRLAVPRLPAIGDIGTADALFLLGGAQTADGFMVPLGLNGGADTADKEANPPDGFADGDERSPGIDPFSLPIAALHSGLQSPHTRYLTVAVAVSIPTGSGDPRPSAGSAVLQRFGAGEAPAADVQVHDFLGFPMSGWWNPSERRVYWAPIAGADMQRVLFKGKRGRHWTIYGSGETDFVQLPDVSDFEINENRIAIDDLESVLINSIDFEDGFGADRVAAGNGLPIDMLLTVVKRVSFIDIKRVQSAPAL